MSQEPQQDRDPLVGQTLAGQYVVDSLLARGGMGNIYIGHQQRLGRTVAIKVLRREFCEDGMVVKRFIREALAVSQLRHPHTAQIFDSGETPEGIHYIVMEYLEGESLDRRLLKDKILDPQTALTFVGQAAAALAEAHAKGIVHRDLKPANIFIVSPTGVPEFVKLLDFGIAKFYTGRQDGYEFTKLTAAGSTMGTPHYMAPEQIRGEEVDGRADVYSLGVILWESLIGRPPYDGNSPMEVFLGHLEERVPNLKKHANGPLPPGLEQVMMRALAKRPGDRFQSMRDLKMVLDSLLSYETGNPALMSQPLPISEIMPASGTVSRDTLMDSKSLSNRRRLMFIFALAALGLVAGLSALVIGLTNDSSQEESGPQATETHFKVLSQPEGAEVWIDGQLAGATPFTLSRGPDTAIQLDVKWPGMGKVSRMLAGDLESVQGLLVTFPLPNAGPDELFSIWIESEPPGAAISKNGVSVGAVTPYLLQLSMRELKLEATEIGIEQQGYLPETYLLIPHPGVSAVIHTQLMAK